MFLTRTQEQILINNLNNISTNPKVHMAAPFVNYVIRPFEGNINHGYQQLLKMYLQATKKIDKEADKLDISVSNA